MRSVASLPRDRWVASPGRLAALLIGLWLFGVGEGLLVAADLGVSPWTVLAQGVAKQTALSIGTTTIIISGLALAAWVPLRQPPGLGTVLNAVLVGISLQITVDALDTLHTPELRALAVPVGVGLVGLGGGIYLACRLGPGPRDGLMTGLHRRTGLSLRVVRTGLELSAVIVGFALGGTVGLGTVVFALAIGQLTQWMLGLLRAGPTHDL